MQHQEGENHRKNPKLRIAELFRERGPGERRADRMSGGVDGQNRRDRRVDVLFERLPNFADATISLFNLGDLRRRKTQQNRLGQRTQGRNAQRGEKTG